MAKQDRKNGKKKKHVIGSLCGPSMRHEDLRMERVSGHSFCFQHVTHNG